MKYSIPLIIRTQDNGDGGYTTYAYNNENDLIADHPEFQGKKFDSAEKKQKLVNEILQGDDEYENGYIGHKTITIEIVDGVARLFTPLHFHAGQ